MLTLTDALQLPELAGASVVAGSNGLHQSIAWVHIASGADAYEWVNGGELVLSTDLNLPDTDAERVQYIEKMAARGVVALALTVGRTIPHVSDTMKAAADRLAFPLIEIPWQTRFVDVARTANQRIAQAPMILVERALNIHRVLSQLVLDGGDLRDLARTMADLIGQSISIETERFEALAAHNVAAYDEARRYTLREGRTDPRLIEALEVRGVLPQIRATLRPVHIPQMADVGLEMERILAPIVVHGDIYGYLWIIADDRPLSDLDRMAIESGATIAALILLHQEAVQDAEAALRGGLLTQLIEGEIAGREATFKDGALKYGIDLDAPYVLFVLDAPTTRTESESGRDATRIGSPSSWARRINRLAESERWRLIVGTFAGQVVALADASQEIDSLGNAIRKQLGSANIGQLAISGIGSSAGFAAAAYGQCRDALTIARRLDIDAPIIRFDDLGYLHALYRAGAGALAANPSVPILRALRQDDGADLFHTLEVYLDTGGGGVATADALHIHRSTLNYRLEQIRMRTGARLDDPLTRMNLQVALKLLRLFEDR